MTRTNFLYLNIIRIENKGYEKKNNTISRNIKYSRV